MGYIDDNFINTYTEQIKSTFGAITPKLIETTYHNLINDMLLNNLVAGALYRIVDYITTVYNTSYARSAGHQFDIIVLATSGSTLSEDALAVQHYEDTYFSDSNLSAWKLKYTLFSGNVHTVNYTWGSEVSNSFRGIIYYMKDEFGNEAPYDFKNIQYARYKVTSRQISVDCAEFYVGKDRSNSIPFQNITVSSTPDWLYTFTDFTNNTIKDASLNKTNNHCLNNSIAEYSIGKVYYLNNIVIFTPCYNGKIYEDCYNITINQEFIDSVIGSSAHDVAIGSMYSSTAGTGFNAQLVAGIDYSNLGNGFSCTTDANDITISHCRFNTTDFYGILSGCIDDSVFTGKYDLINLADVSNCTFNGYMVGFSIASELVSCVFVGNIMNISIPQIGALVKNCVFTGTLDNISISSFTAVNNLIIESGNNHINIEPDTDITSIDNVIIGLGYNTSSPTKNIIFDVANNNKRIIYQNT